MVNRARSPCHTTQVKRAPLHFVAAHVRRLRSRGRVPRSVVARCPPGAPLFLPGQKLLFGQIVVRGTKGGPVGRPVRGDDEPGRFWEAAAPDLQGELVGDAGSHAVAEEGGQPGQVVTEFVREQPAGLPLLWSGDLDRAGARAGAPTPSHAQTARRGGPPSRGGGAAARAGPHSRAIAIRTLLEDTGIVSVGRAAQG